MLHGLRRVGTSVAVMTMLGAGVIATAGTANAAISACPTNYVCVWSGANFTGTLFFVGNATTMENSGDYYATFLLGESPAPAYSTDNSSLGNFCTYDKNLDLSNTLNAKTSGNIANHSVYYIKKC